MLVRFIIVNFIIICLALLLLFSESAKKIGHNSLGRITIAGKSLAVVDIIGTIIIGIIISVVSGLNIILAIIWAFFLGEFMHWTLKIKTPIMNSEK